MDSLTTILLVLAPFRSLRWAPAATSVFGGLVAVWLWFTLLFANFAEAIAEGRGKAQAETLRRTAHGTVGHVRRAGGATVDVPSSQLQIGDEAVVRPDEVIPR